MIPAPRVYPKLTSERRIELEADVFRFEAEVVRCRARMAEAKARKSRSAITAAAILLSMAEQNLRTVVSDLRWRVDSRAPL